MIILFPTYNNIFDGDADIVIKELSTSYPSIYLKIVSSISSQLYFNDGREKNVHSEIIYKYCRRALTTTEDGRKILKWISQAPPNYVLFSNYTIIELYKILLNNYNDNRVEVGKDTTAEDELLFLKLVLIANQNRLDGKQYEKQLKERDDDKDQFYSLHWPIMLPQVDCNKNLNFTFEMCKLLALVGQLEQANDLSKDTIQTFIGERGFDSVVSYVSTLFLINMEYYIGAGDNISKFCIQTDNQLAKLLNPLSINGKSYVDYLTIKAFPLYKDDSHYFILNWNYFANQIYTGTYMNLRATLSRDNIEDNLKSTIGKLTEAGLMRPIMNTAFSKIAQKIEFDCDPFERLAFFDAYIQIGHRIYVFELKDSLMPESVMESSNYEIIKEYLEKTFVCSSSQNSNGKIKVRDKAVYQLISYMDNFINGKYDVKYQKKYVIYPIILYTDYRYEVSGFNDYLLKRFKERIKVYSLLDTLLIKKKIMPLTFIGLEFFFNNMDAFRTKRIKLHELIENYHNKINRQIREHDKKRVQERFMHLYYPFERINHDYSCIVPPKDKEFPLALNCFGIQFPSSSNL